MFDVKLSAIIAGTAFLFSFFMGLISGAGFLMIFARALVFAAIFFALSAFAHWLISRYLPELLGDSSADMDSIEVDSPEVGSHVDVSIGDESPGTISEAPQASHLHRVSDDEEGDSVSDRNEFMSLESGASAENSPGMSSGLDQGTEGRYTEPKIGDARSFGAAGGARPALPSGLIDDVDVLPDLESMSDSFVSPILEDSVDRSEGSSSAESSFSQGSDSGTTGDFDAREMASAIQTILKRDQKG